MTLPGKCKDNFQMECKDPLVRGEKLCLKFAIIYTRLPIRVCYFKNDCLKADVEVVF